MGDRRCGFGKDDVVDEIVVFEGARGGILDWCYGGGLESLGG